MRVKKEEIRLLRDLAMEVKEISAQPVWEEKTQLWKNKNALKKLRPLVHVGIPEEAWPELIPTETLIIRDPLFKKIESDLRRKIYKWENVKDDEIIVDKIYVPVIYSLTDWIEGRVRPYTGVSSRSARFEPILIDYSDLKKLRAPELTIDWARTQDDFDIIKEILGDIMDVRLGEPYYAGTDSERMGWGNSLIDILCELRGLEQVYYDAAVAPEFIKDAMEILFQGTMRYLDSMEQEKILFLNNCEYVNCANTPLGSNGLALTDELPKKGFDSKNITCKDLWGYFQAQEFTPVSPEMLEELVLPYQSVIAGRFGLNCYGCCESQDRKWDTVFRNIPNLREVSVSHAADFQLAVNKISDNYVLSWKPSATEMITNFREHYIRQEMKKAFDTAKNCCLIVCLRDTMSFYGEPQRLWKWTDIAMELALEYCNEGVFTN